MPELFPSQRPLASLQLEAAIVRLDTVENEIATLHEQLSALKAERKAIGETELPELVDEEQLDNGCVLRDGREYTFERQYECSVAEKNRDEAHAWLAAHNADTILKRYIIIEFPKDSARIAATVKTMIARILPQYEVGIKVGKAPDELVKAVEEILVKAGTAPKLEVKTQLPGPTLTAFVKKSVKAGVNLPDCFGVYAPLRAIEVTPEIEYTTCPIHGAKHATSMMCPACYEELPAPEAPVAVTV